MSYEFVKIYNVLEACGWSGDTAIDTTTVTARNQAVKDWGDRELGDIFDAQADSAVSGSNSDGYIRFYFKGTNSGLFIRHCTTSMADRNTVGILHNGAIVNLITSAYLNQGSIRLLVAKSKYGVIAGFYTTDLSYIRSIAINTGTGFLPITLYGATATYMQTGVALENSVSLTQSSLQTQTVLQKFYPPYLDTAYEGVYWNVGQHLTGCAPYKIEGTDKLFLDVPGISGYNTIALELAEPAAEDYAWTTAE